LIRSLPEPLQTLYSDDPVDVSEDRWIYRTLNFITDTVYAGATQAAMMRCAGSKGYSYLWRRPNPVSSSRGLRIADHCTEMIYTTGLYLDELPDGDRELGRRMVAHWIQFAYGDEPWKPRQSDGYDLVVVEHRTEHVEVFLRSNYRRVEAQEYSAGNIDKIGAIFRDFLERSELEDTEVLS